jgi:hypothetical protein
MRTLFWPAIAHGNTPLGCPGYVADLSFHVSGDAQVVGPPLFSEMQIVMKSGSVAYETDLYNSTGLGNNMTAYFGSDKFQQNSPMQYLWQLDPLGGEFNQVNANQTGVNITFQNLTFQGIHIARILWEITVSNSASSASYLLAFPCVGPGLVLTIGSIPYGGPLPYGSVQLLGIIVNNSIALVAAAVLSAVMRFHWRKKIKPA